MFNWFLPVLLAAQHVGRNTGGGTLADSPVSYQDVLSAPNWANLISKRDMCCALFDMLSC